MAKRKRLLVLNQYYAPGWEATAQLLAALCEDLAHTFDVTVVTGRVSVMDDAPLGRHVLNGVNVVRVNSTSYDRSKLRLRAANYVTYMVGSLRVALSARRPDVVVCMTDPPLVIVLARFVALRHRVPLVVVSQDVFPEVAVELGRLTNPLLVKVLQRSIDHAIRRADRVVVIGARMKERVVAKGVRPERIEVIPNWTNTAVLRPEPHDNEWARANDLVGKFVVMHSGNIGYAQNLDVLVRAGSFLRDIDNLAIVIIGAGARLAALSELAHVLDVEDRVRFLPYQPRDGLAKSLSSAHVHVVSLARGLAGYVVPSRLYGVLAVGRPVIAVADSDSETARLVEAAGCGVALPPGRPELLAGMIRRMCAGELDLAELGNRARAYAVAEADSQVAFARYRTLLENVA